MTDESADSMSETAPTPADRISERLERIESALAHLQHDVDSLNHSLLNSFRAVRELESRLTRLEGHLQSASDSEHSAQFSAESEKPPHY
jgi:uncharacterized coiled-coil protein SlyX